MEQTSITKKMYLTLGCALLGAVLALAFPGEMTYEAIAAPVNALGQALRGLSLSGTGGNAAAWVITLVVSLLPLIPFLLLRRKRKAMEDWVLLLLIPQLFALIYYAVNPTLIDSMAAPFLPVGQLGVILATAVTWLVLAFLRALAEAPGERLAAAVGVLLTGCALLLRQPGCRLALRCRQRPLRQHRGRELYPHYAGGAGRPAGGALPAGSSGPPLGRAAGGGGRPGALLSGCRSAL